MAHPVAKLGTAPANITHLRHLDTLLLIYFSQFTTILEPDEKLPIQTAADRNGRTIFEVFRLQRTLGNPAKGMALGPALPLRP
jgi:hypothetical protein